MEKTKFKSPLEFEDFCFNFQLEHWDPVSLQNC